MKSEKEIFEKIGKASYGVPEGYFNDLKNRLEAIPQEKSVLPGPWARVRPYLAMAACFVALLVAGNSLLRRTVSNNPAEQLASDATYAEIISMTHPEIFMNAIEYESEDMTDEDIINYLIESGVEMEYLAYSGGNQKY
ncbi:MAG: hypothetical protein IJ205_00715 [Bacteroidales bacterium]|nr:hypothetical protein [Bacteroidales bacterium]